MSNQLRALLIAFTLLVGLALNVAATVAQEAARDCTATELLSIRTAILDTGFLDELFDVFTTMQSGDVAAIPSIVVQLDDLQVQWWSELAPTLPNCALVNEVKLLVGRLVDESLISSALLQISLLQLLSGLDAAADNTSDMAARHVLQIGSLSDEISLLPARLSVQESQPLQLETWYMTIFANIRECPQLTCEVVAALAAGTPVIMFGEVEGEMFNGSTLWRRIAYEGQEAYVHSSLVSKAPPTSDASISQPQQLVTSPQQWTCGVDIYNCADFSTCGEVMSYFNACPGDPSGLDGDSDGVPCEQVCSG